jgi:hypothetical protein
VEGPSWWKSAVALSSDRRQTAKVEEEEVVHPVKDHRQHQEEALHPLEVVLQETVAEALEAVELRRFQEAFQPAEEEVVAHQEEPSFHHPLAEAWKQALEPEHHRFLCG